SVAPSIYPFLSNLLRAEGGGLLKKVELLGAKKRARRRSESYAAQASDRATTQIGLFQQPDSLLRDGRGESRTSRCEAIRFNLRRRVKEKPPWGFSRHAGRSWKPPPLPICRNEEGAVCGHASCLDNSHTFKPLLLAVEHGSLRLYDDRHDIPDATTLPDRL
ncbi:MAG: hypothetical protein H6Q34_199, partial [Deltaproteobacteria bacterium]|nr:hypothetical protein [Deltaproteobacteria bacterium]